ncbi:hypothetical protein THAOC_06440 [Thalassiosira oceanica]|uniref:Uncharacterized protein n=1 Tax=Thalassiosira oceanica TaxID=159749 RepID=K0TEX1_THAOC|nr:hypothetical protein THAOC_06440 [Thalassiosira oceanica]|eukprot:EJK72066.1 hypothetical protein THAOC_06440 [Thalassiosira oceanica]
MTFMAQVASIRIGGAPEHFLCGQNLTKITKQPPTDPTCTAKFIQIPRGAEEDINTRRRHSRARRIVRPNDHERPQGLLLRDARGPHGRRGGHGQGRDNGRRRRPPAPPPGEHTHHGDGRGEAGHADGEGHNEPVQVRQHERREHPPRARRGGQERAGQEGRRHSVRGIRGGAQLGCGHIEVGMMVLL